jgi:hypothetical protein
MSGSTLPGTGDDESLDRVVLHVDMDCFTPSLTSDQSFLCQAVLP